METQVIINNNENIEFKYGKGSVSFFRIDNNGKYEAVCILHNVEIIGAKKHD